MVLHFVYVCVCSYTTQKPTKKEFVRMLLRFDMAVFSKMICVLREKKLYHMEKRLLFWSHCICSLVYSKAIRLCF